MPTTTNLLTWEAFEQLPSDAMHKEILEGELLVLPPPKLRHTQIATRVFLKLHSFVRGSRLGAVYPEAGYQLSSSPPTWVQPDVSFVRSERLARSEVDGYVQGAPDLAVEVVSPSESAADIERKINLMLAAGALAIWVIYPKSRHVWVYAGWSSQLFAEGDMLSAPNVLPGFELPVKALFED